MQGNLALTYDYLGQSERALSLQRDVYFGYLKLKGQQHYETIQVANNYASQLSKLQCYHRRPRSRKESGLRIYITIATLDAVGERLAKTK